MNWYVYFDNIALFLAHYANCNIGIDIIILGQHNAATTQYRLHIALISMRQKRTSKKG